MIVRLALYRLNILKKQPFQLSIFILSPFMIVLFFVLFFQVSTSEMKVPLAIVDEDNSQYSQIVIKKVQDNLVLRAQVTNRKSAEQLLKSNKIDCIFVFQNGFEKKLLNGEVGIITIVKTPLSLASGMIMEVVASQVLRLSSNVSAANYVVEKYRELGLSGEQNVWDNAWNYTDSQWEPEPLMIMSYKEIDINQALTKQQSGVLQLKSLMGWLLSVLMLAAFLASIWVIDEQKYGVFQRIKTTNVKLYTYLIGNSIPFLLLLVINIYLVFGWDILFYQLSFGDGLKLSFIVIVYAIFCWTLSIALASVIKSVSQFQIVALLITFVTSLASGGIIPASEVIKFLNVLKYFTPQYWVLHTELWKSIPILIGASIIFLVFSYRCLAEDKRH